MNTSKLKYFAQAARKKLMEQVAARLDYILNTDTAELREKAGQVKALKEELTRTGRGALVEKVAYTWFNRLMALRYMDVNDYQPLDIRVLSPKEGYTTPELLDEAKLGHIPDELRVDAQRIYDLLDGRLPSTNPQNEAYKVLLIAACNHLHTVLPFLFERLSDYTELLLPDDLTSEFSIVQEVCNGMAPDDCAQVEVIGWLYQFYISEKKDEVFASKAKVKKEDIPAATQLFTPRWIVEYMVQNTVGKLWLQNKPNSRLREHMPYFIESASQEVGEYLKINGPEELTLLDQACGSGHILVYGFELLAHIYEEEGYNVSDIPRLIIEHNLYGFEIDERAAQLAGMALMMKARSYQRRFFKRGPIPQPTILLYQDFTLDDQRLATLLHTLGIDPSDALLHDLRTLRQVTNYGSLMVPHAGVPELTKVQAQLAQPGGQADVFLQYDIEQLRTALHQLQLLARRYHCVVDNPPYMGGGNMNNALADFVKTNYPDSKADLMACFMESGFGMLKESGFLGLVNQQAWMFLSSYEDLRKKIIDTYFISTLLQIGYNSFPELNSKVVQASTFVIQKNKNFDRLGIYYNLNNVKQSANKRKVFEKKLQSKNCSIINQKEFEKIPGSPIGYWLSENMFEIFESSHPLSSVASLKQGFKTGDNSQFLRYSFEVNRNKLRVEKTNQKWVPCNKGGEFRKWFGNVELVVNWENDGHEIKNFKDENGKLRSRPQNLEYYFKEGLSWTKISSGPPSFRYSSDNFLFESNGSLLVPKTSSSYRYLLGLCNSKFASEILLIVSPTLDFGEGSVGKIPVKSIVSFNESLVDDCVSISKKDWDAKEISFEFVENELFRIKKHDYLDLEETYDLYQQYWRNKFFQLHRNEEELNRQFIDIYGLQDELTPEVPLEEITILKDETSIQKGELVFKAEEVMAQFVSYAVGCMFGRYALDTPGLVLANQGETLQDYLHRVPTPTFRPDADNIIPILDDEWFEDDIVGRFYEFLKVSFGTANFTQNLAFLEECLGKDLRRYFIRDFYNDHISRYKKRPIYWLFSSPQGSFNALIYLHRYTPDTLSQILNKYLREYQAKLRTRQEHLDRVEASGTAAEISKAVKEKAQLTKVLLELQEYEREILYPLAAERITLDLDDGVLVNYNKLGRAVKPVPGLNDAKTKKKVKEFDWIDAGQIR